MWPATAHIFAQLGQFGKAARQPLGPEKLGGPPTHLKKEGVNKEKTTGRKNTNESAQLNKQTNKQTDKVACQRPAPIVPHNLTYKTKVYQ
jgi:hypothetical protein